uniref:Uncharacterized protein n=1 Tax=Picea sitchensis TaxID=3332 RepID=A0A6B9XWE0_PICSI|nr:hypothetical protein Q903MT_gene5656 [Picea sitchensis]
MVPPNLRQPDPLLTHRTSQKERKPSAHTLHLLWLEERFSATCPQVDLIPCFDLNLRFDKQWTGSFIR